MKEICDDCKGTGYIGDKGAGIRGNNEYLPCHCKLNAKHDIGMTPKESDEIYQPLFNLMQNDHGLILTISEMEDILAVCDVVKYLYNNKMKDIWKEVVEKGKF